MITIVVLFNLKTDADQAAYEQWARTTDLPTVRGLPSVSSFEALKTTGVLGKDTPAPYQYIEIIKLSEMAEFRKDVSTEAMQAVAAEFRGFADNPMFITSESIEQAASA